jgi:hypothetical protein
LLLISVRDGKDQNNARKPGANNAQTTDGNCRLHYLKKLEEDQAQAAEKNRLTA